jgi:hypothetical protein
MLGTFYPSPLLYFQQASRALLTDFKGLLSGAQAGCWLL